MTKYLKREILGEAFNFKISQEHLKALTEIAEAEDRTIASIIRKAIEEYLNKYFKK